MPRNLPPVQGRVAWVDLARGVAIALVVLRHTVWGLIHAGIVPDAAAWRDADAAVQTFRMPLFFFLAGLFFPRAAERGAGRFFGDRLRTIAYPYLIWATLQTSVQSMFTGYTNNPSSWEVLAAIAYKPPMQFWFLYALFLASVVLFGFHRIGLRGWAFPVAGVAVLVAESAVDGGWLVLHQVAAYLPYMALGAVSVGMAGRVERLSPTAAAGLTLFGLGGLLAANAGPFAADWPRPGSALLGIAGVAGACRLLAGARAARPLRAWGELSLQILVAHTLASAGFRIALQKGLGVDEPWVHVVGGLAVGLYGPILLHRAAEAVGFRYLFTMPRPRPAMPRPAMPDVTPLPRRLAGLPVRRSFRAGTHQPAEPQTIADQ